MTYSPEDADNKVIILPLRNGSDIDWNFLRSIDTLKDAKLEPIFDEARADFKVKYNFFCGIRWPLFFTLCYSGS